MTTPRPARRVEVTASPGAAAPEVAGLLAAAEEADGFPSISEQARLAVEAGAGGDVLSLLLRADDPAGRALGGFGALTRHGDRWTFEASVAPDRRDGAATAARALVEAAQGHVAESGGGHLSVWVRGDQGELPAWLEARGFRPARLLLQLRALLPVEDGRRGQERPLDVRPFHPGRDEQAWLDVNRRAFADHPEQGSWTLDDLERREEAPWFDPGGFLIHEVGRRIAGFCWTKVHRSPVIGEIYVIGVDPDFQGRGLGRSLTVAGLHHLATRGVPEAMLYVEETNVAALALYRSLGFTEHHREVVFEADVEPGEAAPA